MGTQDVVSNETKSSHNFGAEFRKKLSNKLESVLALKEIKDVDAAEKFLAEGGEITDIISVLKHTDPSDVHFVLIALTHVIKKYKSMASMDDTAACEESCHNLLTVYSSTLHKTFNQHKGVIFDLFSAMVPISFHIAKTVILSFDKCLTIDKRDISVRKEYIHLVDTLLNDDNLFILRSVLEKGFVNKVISGLCHDKFISITTVLKTLNSKIVSNNLINKSLKMQIFNTASLNLLIGLYRFKGPQVQCNSIRKNVHNLLINLCTDYKKGIIYFDETFGTSGQKCNPLIFNFLIKIKTPWEDELTSDLVIKILHSCPDLVKPIFNSYHEYFVPRSTDSFTNLCKFLSTFVNDFNILMKLNNDDLLMNIIKFKLLPAEIFSKIIKDGFKIRNEVSVKNVCIDLYIVLLQKINTTLSTVKDKFPDKYNIVFDYIQSELPPLSTLLQLWEFDLNRKDKAIEHLHKLSDLLLIYCKVFENNFIIDKKINLFDNVLVTENHALYFKVVQINALLYEPSIHDSDAQLGIGFTITNPVDDFHHVFYTLMNACHLFDGFEEELNIWFNSIVNIDISNRTDISSAFIEALTHMDEMLDCLNDETSHNMIDSNLNIHGLMFAPIPNMTSCLPSLLSCCENQSTLEAFINEVIINIFHRQSCPLIFYNIIKQFIKLSKSKSCVGYLKSWSKQVPCFLPESIFNEKSKELQLNKILLSSLNNVEDEDDINNKIDKFVEKMSKKKKKSNKLLNYIRMCLFYTTQCAEDTIISTSIAMFIKLTNLLSDIEKEVIVKESFMNPLIAADFCKESVKFTDLFSYLINIAKHGKNETYMIPYRRLLLPKLEAMINHDKEVKTNFGNSLINLISNLELVEEDSKTILNSMLNKPNIFYNKKKKLSFWGKLLIFIIGTIKPNLTEQDIVLLEKVLIELIDEKIDTNDLQVAFKQYIEYHPYCLQFVNIDSLLCKITTDLIVLMISIKPEIVTYLPKSTNLNDVLKITKALIEYEIPIDSYKSVYKLFDKSIVELINEDNALLGQYTKEIDHIMNKIPNDNIIKTHNIINGKNITLNNNNYSLLIRIYSIADDVDTLFIKLVEHFIEMRQDERAHSMWIHDGLRKTVTETSIILDKNKSNQWNEFIKVCLKDGLNNNMNDSLRKLLDVMKVLPDTCYNTIFKMIISHSQFVEIMLSATELKAILVNILNVLILNGNIPLSSLHIPLFLSSYNATLSTTDQFIFQIIQHYEKQDVNMFQYKPFLYGNTAATYYSISDTILTKTLNRQPHPSQVLSLLSDSLIKKTMIEFPRDRQLIQSDLYMNNNDDANKHESNITDLSKIYDPAFFLPLFTYILSPESTIQLIKFIQNGGLALTFISLCSNDINIRKSAYLVLIRFKTHLESMNKAKNVLLEHYLDVIRNGIVQLTEDNDDKNPRLSNIVSLFLAKSSLIILSPSHPLYSTLHHYFLAKPILDLNKVPEFNVLFNSNNDYNKEWILTIIKDGLNDLDDYKLCDRSIVFKIILNYYNCRLASNNKSIKNLILNIINKCLLIDKAKYYLINNQGLLLYLKEIDCPIFILKSLTSSDNINDQNGLLQILLLFVLYNCKNNDDLLDILNCIYNFLKNNKNKNKILFQNLDNILKVIKNHLGSGAVRESDEMVKHSYNYVLPIERMSLVAKITYLILKSGR